MVVEKIKEYSVLIASFYQFNCLKKPKINGHSQLWRFKKILFEEIKYLII